ncbi:MAG: chromosomal replication initiator protein DnaA [Clostridia bacterium]|nr:chromosomal replication initiator protein DnaA [Clostridia bacterium]
MPYVDDMKPLWEAVKLSMKDSMSQAAVDLWFGELVLTDFSDNVISFTTDSEFKYGFITQKYLPLMAEKFKEQLGFDVEIKLEFVGKPADVERIKKQLRTEQSAAQTPPAPHTPAKEESLPPKEQSEDITLGSTLPVNNFEYTFDKFIVGNSNKFAHAACIAVANHPAENYNPLFIYGPSGLGKTHLMYAITNHLKQKKPNIRIIYIKGADFTNQLIDCLSRQAMSEFRNKYCSCDVLLIDDIQFIAGKVSTQEEFFHTFNTLYEGKKQIILTSDRPPREIKTLEDRLKTRFEWGLIADIQPPDLELRIAIIKKKIEQANITVPNDVILFLAENLRSNIRQIEGAILKLKAFSFIDGKDISMELARSCIAELLGGAEPVNVTVDKIFAAIFKKYNVRREDLVGVRRTKEVAQARHITIYLIRNITEMSFPNIAKIFGKDHSTIMASISTVEKRIQCDTVFEVEINELIKEISGQ